MSRADEGHYTGKHRPGIRPDPVIRNALLDWGAQGELPCATAFMVARRLGTSPDTIGRTADLMELRLTECQLGLFGHPAKRSPMEDKVSVSPDLEKAIGEALVNDCLPCDHAWRIAKARGMKKMEMGAACDALGIKIKPCQLGAF